MYFLSAIGIAMAGAICFYENNNISINRITINKELNEKIKIVQLSDLHSKEFGKENNKLLSKILKEEPDLILLTGDIIDCSSKKYMDSAFVHKAIYEAYFKNELLNINPNYPATSTTYEKYVLAAPTDNKQVEEENQQDLNNQENQQNIDNQQDLSN